MDQIFNACVLMLLDLAELTGLSYKQINVVIFCFLWPIFTLCLVLTVLRQRDEIRKLRANVEV